MATNDFLVVAPGPAPNVASQATYAADPIVTTGNVSGVAKSAIINKGMRQSSIMAAVLAQLIVDNTGANAVDDGTTATLLANLKIALTGRLTGTQIFATPGTYTYTPTPGTRMVRVRVAGAGGGGGGTVATNTTNVSLGGSGSGGSYCESLYTTGFSGVTLIVGLRGSVASGAAGGSGGSSSFAATPTPMSAPGGNGGNNLLLTPPITQLGAAPPAIATGGNILNCQGAAGSTVIATQTNNGSKGWGGVSAVFGYGPGRGGDGQITVASSAATVGLAGLDGIVIIEEYR